jgi:hypothetical protein
MYTALDTVFWNVMFCGVVQVNGRFGAVICLQILGQ